MPAEGTVRRRSEEKSKKSCSSCRQGHPEIPPENCICKTRAVLDVYGKALHLRSELGRSQRVDRIVSETPQPRRTSEHATSSSAEIAVCVCTYRRPDMLADLLDAVHAQALAGGHSLEIVVVDNDGSGSAGAPVKAFRTRATCRVRYVVEPARNISVARNTALAHTSAPLLALIDDDGRPADLSLSALLGTLKASGADGVLGPVAPAYPQGAPAWLRSIDSTQRRRLRTGQVVEARDARTGNVLLRRATLGEPPWFRHEFGRTGGEDSDFFCRQFARGGRYVWCDEAVVTEVVPPERWTVSYHVRRAWRTGAITGSAHRRGLTRTLGPRRLVREFGYACLGLAASAPVGLLPRTVSVRIWQKTAYSLALLSAAAGLTSAPHRD